MKLVIALCLLAWVIPTNGEARGSPSGTLPEPADFEAFRADFRARSRTVIGIDDSNFWTSTSAFLTRRYVAEVAEALFNRADVRIRVAAARESLPDLTFDVRTPHLGADPCSAHARNCDFHCRGWPAGALCRMDEVRCKIGRSAAIAACETKRFALQQVSDIKILTIRLRRMAARVVAGVDEIRLALSPTLDAADLSAKVSANANVGARITVTTSLASALIQVLMLYGLNIPPCIRADGDFEADVGLRRPEIQSQVRLSMGDDGVPMLLDVSFGRLDIDAFLQADAVAEYLRSNPKNFLTCAVPTILGQLLVLVVDEVSIKRPIRVPPFKLPLGPWNFTVADADLTLRLVRTPTSIGFVEVQR